MTQTRGGVIAALASCIAVAVTSAQMPVTDDFSAGLNRWEIVGGNRVRVEESGDPQHGRVMVLEPDGDVFALLKGLTITTAARIDFDVRFPTDEDNYLGVIYNYRRTGARADFGLIYIKGNDSYLQANPHRDGNVGRTLYPEARAALRGAAAIKTGEWQRVRVEIAGRDCHFYVGDLSVPQLTFDQFELTSGGIGFAPRSVGGPAWIDNVSVQPIAKLTYRGPAMPQVTYEPDAVLRDWTVIGPLDRFDDAIARAPDADGRRWLPAPVDARGMVVTGAVVDYQGPRTAAYFRARVTSDTTKEGTFHVSTVDDLALWVNGRFHWFIPRAGLAWFDFWKTPSHAGQKIPIELRRGTNDLIVRVRGGVYASGGFFARVE